MSDAILNAWRRNQAVTMQYLDVLEDEHFTMCLTPRTRTVAAQFAHIHYVRVKGIEERGREFLGDLGPYERGAQPTRDELLRDFTASGAAMEQTLAAALESGKLKSWGAGVETYVGYLIAHEEHHRALVLASIRLNGAKAPQELSMGVWGSWRKPV